MNDVAGNQCWNCLAETKRARNCPQQKETFLSELPSICATLGKGRNGKQHPLFTEDDMSLVMQITPLKNLIDRMPLDKIPARIWNWSEIIQAAHEGAQYHWQKVEAKRRTQNG